MSDTSTIAALATAPVPAGIAVVRISGPKTKTALKSLFRSKHSPVAKRRELVLGEVIDFQSGEVIDKALAVYMPGPYSFTGEDIGEFQVHGSPLLVQKILRSLYAFGIEPAEAGEFSKRAFLNGKMDLVQAEAIADLISATSDQALLLAGEHLRGGLSQALQSVGEPLRDVLAELEAGIDFPDEDIEPMRLTQIQKNLEQTLERIGKLLSTHAYGQVVKEGFRVLLCGKPNVGKSSLLNCLLETDRAIVTDISGTTRDLIEEQALISGYKFVFCDSAGIRNSDDTVEKIGIELAKSKIDWADLVLIVVDATDGPQDFQEILSVVKPKAKKIWMIVNKVDLNPKAFTTIFCDSRDCAQNFYISAKSQDGMEQLRQALIEELKSSLPDRGEASGIVTNERHKNCLKRATAALQNALEALSKHMPVEIVSAEIRLALVALEEIVGKTYTEDILGRIFSKFCIGK